MALRGRTRITSDRELNLRIVEGLRTAARRPNIHGYEPHGKQLIFHRSPARGKLFIGGNRSGKTVGGGTEAVFRATGKHPFRPVKPPPTYGRIVAVDFLQGVEKIVRPEIARWLPASELLGGSWETAYDRELRTLNLENGSTIEFMSYDQALVKFAGTSRDWTWFDEEPPEDIYQECLMRLVDVGGDWWITMTPVEGMTWTYDRIYERARPSHPDYDPNLFVVEVESAMNPHLNAGELDILLAGMDKDDRSARERGQYVQRGGLIYPNFKDTLHVIPPIDPRRFDTKNWMHFAMMDHGLNNATAWHWAAIDREGRMVVYDEYHSSGEVVKTHAANVLAKNAQHGVIPSYNVGDPSIRNRDPITGTSIQIEYVDHGVPIILGNNDVLAGIDVVRRRFGGPQVSPTLLITENNPELIWELKRYRWQLWANKRQDRDKNKKEEPHKKDDHHCDAIRYGAASRPQLYSDDFSIPEESMRPIGNTPVNPYAGRTDPATDPRSRDRRIVDEILGSEW